MLDTQPAKLQKRNAGGANDSPPPCTSPKRWCRYRRRPCAPRGDTWGIGDDIPHPATRGYRSAQKCRCHRGNDRCGDCGRPRRRAPADIQNRCVLWLLSASQTEPNRKPGHTGSRPMRDHGRASGSKTPARDRPADALAMGAVVHTNRVDAWGCAQDIPSLRGLFPLDRLSPVGRRSRGSVGVSL
jgi:hypothetical protein